jgi:hypothetical protein
VIDIVWDKSQINRLKKLLQETKGKLSKELAVAVNATAKTGKSGVVKEIAKELAVTQKVISEKVSIKGKATATQLQSTVTLKKSRRISLREFKPKQNKSGVSYKISKTKGRNHVAGAFQGPKPGVMKVSWRGNAFRRLGKSRLPIVKLKGPSPWGVVKTRDKEKPLSKDMQAELKKQVERRIRFLTLKAQGKLNHQNRG